MTKGALVNSSSSVFQLKPPNMEHCRDSWVQATECLAPRQVLSGYGWENKRVPPAAPRWFVAESALSSSGTAASPAVALFRRAEGGVTGLEQHGRLAVSAR
ncbi:hypothetical protein NFI96_006023 [Prochilodus magdalenae]|nr:hypothetical protein NFI96_006023 [Prochilodus magdalenae]